jgi:hypothetical protein
LSIPDLTIPRFNAAKARGAHGALRASTNQPGISQKGTGLTASYEGQIREVWGKALIQKREQATARQWDCTIHRTRHGKGQWYNGL